MGRDLETARRVDGSGKLEEKVGDYAAQMGAVRTGLAVRRHARNPRGA